MLEGIPAVEGRGLWSGMTWLCIPVSHRLGWVKRQSGRGSPQGPWQGDQRYGEGVTKADVLGTPFSLDVGVGTATTRKISYTLQSPSRKPLGWGKKCLSKKGHPETEQRVGGMDMVATYSRGQMIHEQQLLPNNDWSQNETGCYATDYKKVAVGRKRDTAGALGRALCVGWMHAVKHYIAFMFVFGTLNMDSQRPFLVHNLWTFRKNAFGG